MYEKSTLMSYRFPTVLCLILLMGVTSACRKKTDAPKTISPRTVNVSQPVKREVTAEAEFIGRTEAVDSVDVKARVTGYLLKTAFIEGTEVKAGDVLFNIDPRTYQAQVDAAQGGVGVNEAKLRLAETEN